jgi:hypothetical protein
MTKYRSHRRRPSSKSRTMRRQRGGDLAGNPPSSWGWVNGTVGNGWTQFMNSLTLQPGQNLGTVQSNNIVPVNNINAQDAQPGVGSNLQAGIPNSVGGKRRRRNKSKAKRGGSWGAILNQATVPGILLAAQQTFGKTRNNKRNSRYHRRR